MHIGNARIWSTRHDHIADRMHEMGFTQADAAIDKQRVIGHTGIAAHLHGGSLGQLIALALDEIFEGVLAVESATDRGRDAWLSAAADRLPLRTCHAADLDTH